MSWRVVCSLDAIPQPGGLSVKSVHGDIAVFRNEDNEVFAVSDQCPHRGVPLWFGTVSGRTVECPRHGWQIGLDDGKVRAPEFGCVRTFPVKIVDGSVLLDDQEQSPVANLGDLPSCRAG